jgi:hypothetical protein
MCLYSATNEGQLTQAAASRKQGIKSLAGLCWNRSRAGAPVPQALLPPEPQTVRRSRAGAGPRSLLNTSPHPPGTPGWHLHLLPAWCLGLAGRSLACTSSAVNERTRRDCTLHRSHCRPPVCFPAGRMNETWAAENLHGDLGPGNTGKRPMGTAARQATTTQQTPGNGAPLGSAPAAIQPASGSKTANPQPPPPPLVLSCLIRATGWANAPRWGGRLRCWLATPLPLPQQWTSCSAVQIVTRVPLSLYLGPRLVNVVSLACKILTANHVLIMQWALHRTTDECSIRVPQMSGRQF